MISAVQNAVVDLLANGPSSFAAVYGFLVRTGATPRDFDLVWCDMADLERAGIVSASRLTAQGVFEHPSDSWRLNAVSEYRVWLADLEDVSPEALSVDEIGLWYLLTEQGQALAQADPTGAPWSLDVDEAASLITVQAGNESTARRALADWVSTNPECSEANVVEVMPIEEFVLRTGQVVRPATRVVAMLRKNPQ
jgi:hypothetical protein